MVTSTQQCNGLQIVLTPNRSATWQHNCHILWIIGVVVFVIACFWSFMGVWMILPFAGLELTGLCYLVYRTSKKAYQQEVLHLHPDTITLERGQSFPNIASIFNRSGCEFIIQKPRHYLSPASIAIEHQGEKTPLGQFLNKQDMECLVELIKTAGVNYRVRGRTLINEIQQFDL